MKCTVRRINVNLTEKEDDKLRTLSRVMGQPESEIVRQAILQFTRKGNDLHGANFQER